MSVETQKEYDEERATQLGGVSEPEPNAAQLALPLEEPHCDDRMQTVREAVQRHDFDAARSLLEGLSEAATQQPGLLDAAAHKELAALASQLGMGRLAMRVLRLVLREHPDEVEALLELALLHQDRGEHEEERRCRERLMGCAVEPLDNRQRLSELRAGFEGRESAEPSTDVPQLTGDVPISSDPLLDPAVPELVRFLHLFAGREDVHARQWFDGDKGGYTPIRRPLTMELLRAHLAGAMTLGVYPLRLDGTVTFAALDFDLTKRAIAAARGDKAETRRLRRMLHEVGLEVRDKARSLGFDALLEDSGYKGRHLWFFFDSPQPAQLAQRFVAAMGRLLQPLHPEMHVECFPKQSRVKNDGLGNLIKLPLGLHLRSHRRSVLLDEEGRAVVDPWPWLRLLQRSSSAALLDGLERLRSRTMVEEEQLPGEPPRPPVVLREREQPFVEADFASRPELQTLLLRCGVLKALLSKALHERRLDYEEAMVLKHTLGHLPIGPLAYNYVVDRCPELGPSLKMGERLKGNPVSCAKIRKRLPSLTASVNCHCEAVQRPDHYPTPLLHLDGMVFPLERGGAEPTQRVSAQDDLSLARTFSAALEQQRRAQQELEQVRHALVDALMGLPDRRLELPEGLWSLVDEEGMPTLQWTPASGATPDKVEAERELADGGQA